MVKFYIVPKVGTGTYQDQFRPKYFREMGLRVNSVEYGVEGSYLVGADVTPEQDATLVSNADVYAILPLNDQVGGNPALNQTRNRLEQSNIPGNWIVEWTTNREIVGTVGRVSMVLQRLQGRHQKRIFGSGMSLDSALTPELVADLTSVAGSLGVTVPVSTAMNVRDGLLAIGRALPPFTLMGETI